MAPSSGAILLSMLNILENFDVSLNGAAGSAANATGRGGGGRIALNVHRLVEAIKFGTAQKTLLGDPLFSPDVEALVRSFSSKELASKNAVRLNNTHTFEPDYYGESLQETHESGTCHISVIKINNYDEGDYEAVSFTTTINDAFGSFLMDPKTGILLNNEMRDFSIPNTTDALNRTSNPRNFPEPGKRPLSSMIPTIIETEGGVPVLIIGGSGGKRIFPSVFEVMVRILDWGMNATEAVKAPRVYHPLTPNVLEVEHGFRGEGDVLDGLKERGHFMKVKRQTHPMASLVQAIQVRGNGMLDVAVDPRVDQIVKKK
ncbi:hypothetical protein HK102_011812 [Quaeritorhiza haematococci]|nr:hypothetical protein HK102_011812 [Quaeritorhiza haematococci]